MGRTTRETSSPPRRRKATASEPEERRGQSKIRKTKVEEEEDPDREADPPQKRMRGKTPAAVKCLDYRIVLICLWVQPENTRNMFMLEIISYKVSCAFNSYYLSQHIPAIAIP